MRRRPPDLASGAVAVPPYLATYDPDDWLQGCHPSCSFWTASDAFRNGLTDEQRGGLPFEAMAHPDIAWHPELI